MFKTRKTNLVYEAVRLERLFHPDVVKSFNWLFFLLAIFFFLVFMKPGFLNLSSEEILGIFILCILAAIKGLIYLLFLSDLKANFSSKKSLVDEIASGKNLKDINLAEYLGFRVTRAIAKTSLFCKRKNIPLDAFIVVCIFLKDKRVKAIFEKLDLDFDLFKQKLKDRIEQLKGSKSEERFLSVLEKAAYIANTNFHSQIWAIDFLVAVAIQDQSFIEILAQADMKAEDVDHVVAWEDYVEHEFKVKKQFWRLENLMKIRGIGKQWAAGYTVNLDRYSIEVSKIIRKQDLSIHLMAHEKEVYAIERILARSGENNILLIGRPGVGRSTIAYSFAKKACEGRSFSNLNDKRILELDIQAALAGLDTEGEMLRRLKIIFSEAVSAGNVILIIDEIHNYLGSNKGPGAINIGPVIAPYLSSPNFQVIGISSYDGWHKYIENNSTIRRSFVKLEINEPDKLKTILILEDMLPGLEKKYKVYVNYRVLRDIVELTDQYIQNIPFPEKAIDLLTEILVYTKRQGKNKVLSEYVNQIISERTEIPVGAIKEEERQKLLNLEKIIHKRIINQEEAVKMISEAMRRARAGVQEGKRPIGSFLFLGPTGVGKTETSKALANAYFGSSERMIRFDMSEYQQIQAISRLIGMPEKDEPGLLTKAIADDPFSLVLFDEIEKTNPNILNLFLQVFDEGWLTDAFGRKVSFRNSIIIGTSNAGAELIRQKVRQGKGLETFKDELIDYLLKQNLFRPEFLNRFDAVVVFKPLTHENLIEIAKLMLTSLANRLYEGKGIRFVISHELVDMVAKLGYEPEFGARPMRRVIQDKIESKIARDILENNLKRGDFVEIKLEELK
ncbi:MAG: AAA family ATPase [Patescibacteria group bacterium]